MKSPSLPEGTGFVRGISVVTLGLFLVLNLSSCGSDSGSPVAPSAVAKSAVATSAAAPNYTGIFEGTFTISDCGHTGEWAPCSESTYAPGVRMAMKLTQSGTSVSGVLVIGSVVRSVTGSVRNDGHLVLNGSTTVSSGGLPITFTIVGWDTELGGIDMFGSWKERITSSKVTGFIQWVSTIERVAKAETVDLRPASLGRGEAKGTIWDLLGIRR